MANVFTLTSRTLPAGQTTSPNFQIPAGISSVTIACTIASPDVNDATKSFKLTLNRSDGAGGFIFDASFTWDGGPNNPRTGLPRQPTMTFDVGPLSGQTCQLVFVANNPVTLSAVVTAA